MAKKLTIKDLIKEVQELKEEIKKAKTIVISNPVVYPHVCPTCPLPHYPQTIPNPNTLPQWTIMCGGGLNQQLVTGASGT